MTFLKALKTDGVPPQIDKSVLNKLSGGLQGQLKMTLRSLGLMEGDKPTDRLKAIVDAYDTPAFDGLLLDRLKATYPYVFDLDLMVATPTMFADAFKVTGAKEDVLRKCRTFFLHAAKRAGVQMGPRLQTGSVPRGPTNGGVKRKPRSAKVLPVEQAGSSHEPPPSPDQKTSTGFAEALLEKFPKFDPGWSDELKAKWFEGFQTFMGMASGKS
jgi:hypothetical protein